MITAPLVGRSENGHFMSFLSEKAPYERGPEKMIAAPLAGRSENRQSGFFQSDQTPKERGALINVYSTHGGEISK
jgi:hypothetical protein